MLVTTTIETRAHPASAQQWALTDEGIAQLCADMKGLPVTMKYAGGPIGTGVSAERAADGSVTVTLDVENATTAALIEQGGYAVGPALANADASAQMRNAGVYELGAEWRATMLGVVARMPVPEPAIIGEAA